MTPPQALPLADIHLPSQISLWPPAYGWWILILLILTLLYFCLKSMKTWRANRVQKNTALTQLAAIDLSHATAWQQINEVLKRAAMVYYSREQVASLTGEKWKTFLIQGLKGKPVEFDDNWLNFAYLPHALPEQVKTYHQFAQRWLKQALPVKASVRRANEGAENV
ncbi:MAG: hypothetical protein ACI9FJ_002726 [Alteromonadaceae bacterium]|jgi:hypothetical protein